MNYPEPKSVPPASELMSRVEKHKKVLESIRNHVEQINYRVFPSAPVPNNSQLSPVSVTYSQHMSDVESIAEEILTALAQLNGQI